jgi:Fe-S oxidoreductase
MCNKCVEVCPVGIDSTRLKLLKREESTGKNKTDFSYLGSVKQEISAKEDSDLLYYAGCMTHLVPSIYKSIFKILNHAKIKYSFMDSDGSICCGRPLMLSGNIEGSKHLIKKNTEIIKASGCKILLVSCPICYKIFNEEYKLDEIKVIHHSVFINDLVKNGRITLKKSDESFVFHDPCELGRGSGIYSQPRELLNNAGNLKLAAKEKGESICCGGSLGSLTLSGNDREHITKDSLKALLENNPDKVVTACPLCLKSFSQYNHLPTRDIAQIVSEQLI